MIGRVTSLAEVPPTQPARYVRPDGYVVLRWKVAPGKYVECREHRMVAGFPPDGMDVHHKNRIPDDNRPENLVVLTPEEHKALHDKEDAEKHAAAKAARGGHRSNDAHQRATRAAARRQQLAERNAQMRKMYESGRTVVEIGEAFGIDNSNVSRHLRAVGTKMRRQRKNKK